MGSFDNFLSSGGGSLAGGLVGAGLSVFNNERNIYFQKQMNELNWQHQQQMIADERAYNDPSEVMKRYEKAGINTTFAGMNPSINGGSDVGSQAPVQGIAPVSNVDLSSSLGAIGQSAVIANQKKEVEAQVEALRSQCEYNAQSIKESEQRVLQGQQSIKNLQKECEFIASQIGLTDMQAWHTFQNGRYQERLYDILGPQVSEAKIKKLLYDKAYIYFRFHEPEMRPYYGNMDAFALDIVPGILKQRQLAIDSGLLSVRQSEASSASITASSLAKDAETRRQQSQHSNEYTDALTLSTMISAGLLGQQFQFYSSNPDMLYWNYGGDKKSNFNEKVRMNDWSIHKDKRDFTAAQVQFGAKYIQDGFGMKLDFISNLLPTPKTGKKK